MTEHRCAVLTAVFALADFSIGVVAAAASGGGGGGGGLLQILSMTTPGSAAEIVDFATATTLSMTT